MTCNNQSSIVRNQAQLHAFGRDLRCHEEPSSFQANMFMKEYVADDLVPQVMNEDLFQTRFES